MITQFELDVKRRGIVGARAPRLRGATQPGSPPAGGRPPPFITSHGAEEKFGETCGQGSHLI